MSDGEFEVLTKRLDINTARVRHFGQLSLEAISAEPVDFIYVARLSNIMNILRHRSCYLRDRADAVIAKMG